MHPLTPLFSIITICRNSQSTIQRTMESVISQSFRDFEYIVVDGNSSDGTQDHVKEVFDRLSFKNFKFLSESDKGISDAMNKGVSLATGRIIVHLHAGDWFTDNKVIDRVAKSWKENQWRWGVASSNVVTENGKVTHVYRPLVDVETLIKKNGIPHQSTFLDRDIFVKHGGFDVKMHQAMDYEMWLRIAFKGQEKPFVLPYITTNFLAGGASGNLQELLRACYRLRKRLPEYNRKTNKVQDMIYLGRILAFGLLQHIKK